MGIFGHQHSFGQLDEIVIPIGPAPYHTKEVFRACACGAIEFIFGHNWKTVVPDDYKTQFREELKKAGMFLVEPQ